MGAAFSLLGGGYCIPKIIHSCAYLLEAVCLPKRIQTNYFRLEVIHK
jgi:hypothetical protein